MDMMPLLLGQAAGAIDSILSTAEIIDGMMTGAINILQGLQTQIVQEVAAEAQARL